MFGILQTHAQKEINNTSFKIPFSAVDSVQLLQNQASIFEENKDFLKTASTLEKALELSKNYNDFQSIKKIIYRMEFIYRARLKEYDKAEKINRYLMGLCKQKKDTSCYIRLKLISADLEKRKYHYLKAFLIYEDMHLFSKTIKDTLSIIDIHISKSIFLHSIGEFDSAKKKLLEALKMTKPVDSLSRKSIYINLSNYFSSDSSLYYLQKAKSYSQDKIKADDFSLHNNIAWYYVEKNMPVKALEIMQKNIDFDKIELYRNDYGAILHTMGTIYFQLSDYSKSAKYYENALIEFQKEAAPEDILLTLNDLHTVYKKTGEKEKLIGLLDSYKHFYPILHNEKLKKKLAVLEINKQLKKKEKKLSASILKNQEMENSVFNSQLSFYILSIIMLIATILIILRNHSNKVKFYKLENKLAFMRLQSLRAIMNPHFLFNSFSTLQNFILKKEHLKANDYMTELSLLIRNVLYNSNSVYISFKDELKIIQSYIKLELEKLDNTIEVSYTIDSKLTETNPMIPSMIIQPFVENAIIHGLTNSDKDKKLEISFKKDKNAVYCEIKDNGVGINHKKEKAFNQKHLSIATKNTNERLMILKRLGYKNAKINITDLTPASGKSKGTKIEVTLPIISNLNLYEK